ncbi:MAG: hypothetical protein AB1810_10265 [Pseudomonadota bacterium]
MARFHWSTAAVAILMCLAGTPAAHADSDVSIGFYVDIPAVMYPAPPPMVWYPELGVYIALGSPHRLFFYMGDYFRFYNDDWYIAYGYGGPWRRIDRHRLPPHLRDYRDRDWEKYQHEAERHYRRGYGNEHPPFPAWRERGWDERHDHDWRRERGRGHDYDD